MKKLAPFYRNIPLTLSVGAYMALATTATAMGLLTAAGLTALSYAVGLLLPNVWGYTKANAGKGHWAASVVVCILMGLRFDSVWKNSGQLLMRISTYLDIDICRELTNTQGCRVLYCTLQQG